jgi:hypothetical protein
MTEPKPNPVISWIIAGLAAIFLAEMVEILMPVTANPDRVAVVVWLCAIGAVVCWVQAFRTWRRRS